MEGVIDPEALQQDEMSPDAYALAEVVKQLSPLLNESFELYSDVRRKLVDQCMRKPKLTFTSSVVADCAPSDEPHNTADYEKIRQAMIVLKSQLRQLEAERKGSIQAAANALAQYKSENEALYKQLSEYRMKEAMETDSSTYSTHSSMSSASVTPRTVPSARRGSRIADSPVTPKRRTPAKEGAIESSFKRRTPTPSTDKKVTFTPRPEGKGAILDD